jgi:hypothetical protein
LIEGNNLSRTRFEQLYKRESDADVKERMLLVLNVIYDKQIPARVAITDNYTKIEFYYNFNIK